MNVEKKELHVKLQELRDANKVKNREIANTLDVSEPTVSNWMNGTSTPNRENLKALADFFNVPVAYLNGINEENKEEINKLLDKNDTLQAEIANKDRTIESLREAQNYQRKALLILIGAVLIIGAAVFRSDLPENPTTSQGLLFLVTLGIGLFFFIPDFKDSTSLRDECNYLYAKYLMAQGDLKNAYGRLIDCNGYEDATSLIDNLDKTNSLLKLSTLAIGDTFVLGSYEQDNVSTNGKEPIEWILINNDNQARIHCYSYLYIKNYIIGLSDPVKRL